MAPSTGICFCLQTEIFFLCFQKDLLPHVAFLNFFARPHENVMVTKNGLKMVPPLKGACAFIGTQHSDAIIFKAPPIHPTTRVQQNGICKHFYSGEYFWNDALLLFGDRFQQIRVVIATYMYCDLLNQVCEPGSWNSYKHTTVISDVVPPPRLL